MTDSELKTRHDAARAVRHFGGLIALLEADFDFKSPQGKVILEEAKKARTFLDKYLEKQSLPSKK